MGRTGRIYRKVRATLVDEPSNFGWIVKGKLAASGLPSSKGQITWLSEHGINRILSLTEKPIPAEWLGGSGISVKHIPMRDHEAPDIEHLIEASGYIRSEVDADGVVLVHCLAGKGRTGSAIAAYLIDTGKMDAKKAIEYLREMRPGSVEGRQVDSVIKFEKRLRKGSKAP